MAVEAEVSNIPSSGTSMTSTASEATEVLSPFSNFYYSYETRSLKLD